MSDRRISDGHPVAGYYRMRKHKDGPYQPVVIWEHDGELVCRVGEEMADVNSTWLFCADKRVSKADALYAFQHGRWPGDAPEAPAIGDNQPPSGDPLEELTRELEAEHARVSGWVAEPHEGKTAADMAANWLDQLRKLEKRVESAFDEEKAPVRAESQRIDLRWRGAKALAEKIKRAMSDRYDAIARKEKKRLQDIADAKAREEADKRRKEWEAEQAKLAAMAAEHGVHHNPDESPTPAVVLVAEPVKVAFGGAQGSRIAPRKLPPVAVVEDWKAAAAHYSGSPKIREVIQKLATQDAKNGVEVPGVKIIPGE